MSITPMDGDLNIIAKLPDEPNDMGGLTAARLKEKFDEGGNALKNYLNEKLIPELDAEHLPYQYGLAGSIKNQLDKVALGQIPDGSITAAKLSGDLVRDDSGLYTRDETLIPATAALFGLGDGAVPDDVFGKIADGALFYSQTPTLKLSQLANGQVFQLPEDGGLADFIKMKDDYESSGRTLVLRKDLYDDRPWHSSDVNAYATSTIDAWLNGAYLGLLGGDVQSAIAAVTIPYTPGNGNGTLSSLSRKVFLLSLTETGEFSDQMNIEGTPLSYFTTHQSRIAQLNGVATGYWVRSPRTSGTTYIGSIAAGGTRNVSLTPTASRGSRPAFTLPSDFEVVSGPAITDAEGNLISIPSVQLDRKVRAMSGMYYGTGTSGAGGPNKLSFDFQPSAVIVKMADTASQADMCTFVRDATKSYINTGSGSSSTQTVTWTQTGLSWYNIDAASQLNTSNTKYVYFAASGEG